MSLLATQTLAHSVDAQSEMQNKLEKLSQKVSHLESILSDSKSYKQKDITVINQKSPIFLFGKQTHPNMKIVASDNKDMWIKAGVRAMGTLEYRDNKRTSMWDAYLRRVRFEFSAGFSKHLSFTMDIRNDKANYQDKGEQTFNVGDAYLKIKNPLNTSLLNFKLYRGKIDVSRTETVKSAYLIHYDRPHVADSAAQYISHNRRATNIQMYGNWNKKIDYQIAIGDGIYSKKLKDAKGASFKGNDFRQKSFFYGGKVCFSPFDGWEERKRTETYFAEGKHFSFGLGYWKSPDITYIDATGTKQSIDHTLTNAEISAHYKGAFLQAEYFWFDGVVKDFSFATQTGKSEGWYVTGEYVIKDVNYLAPFFRYEQWDRWNDEDGYDLTSTVVGMNWYLRGNTTKVGLSVQSDDYDKNIGDYKDIRYKLTTQFFF